jgi:hypothetical protein
MTSSELIKRLSDMEKEIVSIRDEDHGGWVPEVIKALDKVEDALRLARRVLR